jgi:hypothetical protein
MKQIADAYPYLGFTWCWGMPPPNKKGPLFSCGPFEKTGAGDEIRTHDFNLGKVALYP